MNPNRLPNDSAPKGYEAERMVREILEKKFGKALPTRTLVVGRRSTGEAIRHEFDLVSEDKNIVGEVKSDKYTEKHDRNTRFPRILVACKYLELVKAEKKLLVLTNKEMYEVRRRDLDGLIDSDIEIMHVDLGS